MMRAAPLIVNRNWRCTHVGISATHTEFRDNFYNCFYSRRTIRATVSFYRRTVGPRSKSLFVRLMVTYNMTTDQLFN